MIDPELSALLERAMADPAFSLADAISAHLQQKIRKAFEREQDEWLSRVLFLDRWIDLLDPPPPSVTLEDIRLNNYQVPKDFEQYDRIYQAAKPKGRNEISTNGELFGVPIIIESGGPGIRLRIKRSSNYSPVAVFSFASLADGRVSRPNESLTGWRAALRQVHRADFKNMLLSNWNKKSSF